MKTPTGSILRLASVTSTQTEAALALRQETETPGIILASTQTEGRGRFQRPWFGEPGSSLFASLIFPDYSDHKEPWLVGMAVGLAVASALHAKIQWPNDVTIGKKKVAGILSELHPDNKGRRVPVIGVGVNLNISEFPAELSDKATSVLISRGHTLDPEETLVNILSRLRDLPEPTSWDALKPVWSIFDDTPGKKYQTSDGQSAVGLGIGPRGELICSVDGETQTILAAESIFGDSLAV
ncbi:MAG: biotin--[acetyl-CoA-carboxylase] ligase [Fimbriimonadaceae bacterium]|jgi:BirA family biotin operon repressor/biotin-[acetyl-CoA-carboxylase] ligase|nr:biotin--[acetyl-CoA-carboxylase] ligase [Fimbriimonadaceae bacterium]